MERAIDLVLPLKNGQVESAAGDGAATVYASLRPPLGEVWLVDWAMLLHDNAAAKVCAWYWYDGSTRTTLFMAGSIASTVYVQVSGIMTTVLGCFPTMPIQVNYASYLQAGCVAAEAGKKVYINYMVRRICGVEPWTNS